MKTIFFLLPTGLSTRNFLFTGVLERLLAQDGVRVIVPTPMRDISQLYHVQDERLVFDSFPSRGQYNVASCLHAVLRKRFYKINENSTLKIFSKGPLSPRPGGVFLDKLLSQPLPRSKTLYRGLRALADMHGGVSSEVRRLFRQYQPCLLVASQPTAMYEYDFRQHARKAGVPSVGILKSWDVLTTKGYIPVQSDYYLVWNQVMKDEITELYGSLKDRVGVTGIPQFDIYADTSSAPSREEFLSRHGLDPAKRTILYCTSTPWINPEDPEILRQLMLTLGQGRDASIQVLARLHPLDPLERYGPIADANLGFQVPGAHVASSGDQRWLDPRFLTDLRDTLLHSDVVVNTASTMSLDAVAMDRPVINISFDLESRGYYRSRRRYYDFDHIRPIVESGATMIAGSLEELVSLIGRYLENPALESVERAGLRQTMCYGVDGQSARRIADYILRVLHQQPFNAQAPAIENLAGNG